MTEPANCQCNCGAVRYRVKRPARFRFYCHCTICQAFNQAAFADISVFRPQDVELPDPAKVEFRAYRPPPAVQRGTCRSCGKPAIEDLQILAMPRLIMVPSACIQDPALLPSPVMHAFYNRRLADADDGLPKYNGYLPSQLGFGRHFLSSYMHGPAQA